MENCSQATRYIDDGEKNKQPDNSYLKYYPELDFFLFYFLLFAPMLHDGLRRDDTGTFF